MRYCLRTLLILLALVPPLLWLGWSNYETWRIEQDKRGCGGNGWTVMAWCPRERASHRAGGNRTPP
jgi:hypothetical protein